MAVFNVPGEYAKIAAAVAATSSNFDDIVVAAGYAGNETVLVTTDGLTFDIADGVPNIVLTAAPGVEIYANGYGPMQSLKIGDAGNNILTTDGITSVLQGAAGDDVLVMSGSHRAVLDGGAGTDTASFLDVAPTAGMTISLATGWAEDSNFAGGFLVDVENVIGTRSADQIDGDDQFNVLTGEEGDDRLSGGGGLDTLIGGRGADFLDGGEGNDTASYLEPTGVQGVTVNLATGAATDNWGDIDTLIAVEHVTGSARRDTLSGDGRANILIGGGGDDMLTGAQGNDTLNGGEGIDTANYFEPTTTGGVIVYFLNPEFGYGIDSSSSSDLLYSIENIIGTAFADQIQGSSSNNVLTGNAGADELDGSAGSDTASYFDRTGTQLHGVTVDLGSNVGIDNWGDSDTLTSIENVIGSSLDDSLTGDNNANSLTGGAGNDILRGGGGNDVARYDDDQSATTGVTVDLSKGTATDTWGDTDTLIGVEKVVGSRAADILTGDDNANTLNGGGGNDVLFGGGGNDWLLAGAGGADTMSGGAGDDRYRLNSAGDRVIEAADGGIDTVFTGIDYTLGANVENVRADTSDGLLLTGNRLDNGVVGGTGDDTLAGRAGNDALDGNLGTDTATYLESSGVRGVAVDLAAGTATDNWGGSDTLIGVENIVGSARRDKLTGDGNANTLSGGGGDDMLSGGANGDTLDGGTGIDTANYFDPAATAGITVDLSQNEALDSYGFADSLIGVENVVASSFADELHGDQFDNVLTGNAGTDFLDGMAGIDTASYFDISDTQIHGVTVNLATSSAIDNWGDSDTLAEVENVIGSSLDDTLTGDANANSLTGGAGNDTLDGGAGNDLVRYDDDKAATVGVTVDLSAGTATDSWADTDTLIGIEKVVGSRAADTLTGDANDNTLNGSGGNDVLFGGGGNDWLLGARGADRMSGGAGNDRYRVESTADRVIETADEGVDTVFTSIDYTLGANVENLRADSSDGLALSGNSLDNDVTGGDGNDTLNGGAGRDTLTGGLGSDAFLFDSALGLDNVDLVADFSVSDDTIALGHGVFTQLAVGSLAPDAFVIGSAAQNASDRIVYNGSTGVLSYDADGTGSGAAVNFARLTPGLALTSGNFIVV